YGWGGVFDMDISGAVTTLCQIRGNEGTGPLAALIQASDGNFYGTTGVGGEQRAGRSSGSTRRGVSLRSTASHRGSLRTAFNPWRAPSRLQEPSMEPPLPAERTTAAPSSGSTRL